MARWCHQRQRQAIARGGGYCKCWAATGCALQFTHGYAA
eukprot:gene50901-24954_t